MKPWSLSQSSPALEASAETYAHRDQGKRIFAANQGPSMR